ncbi:MAG: ATP-binding cassette domain-containing protein, partial [Bacteroidota bacterium]
DQLSLDIPEGTIYGILGPNGSGKTTTLGMVMDVIHPTSGDFKWFGAKPNRDARKHIGAILEGPLFYPYLTGYNNLRVVAEIKGVGKEKIEPVLDTVGLLARKDSRFKTYSLGMKQRLAIAAALLGDPKVLILDEPTNGLDPQGIKEIRELIREIGQRGITILLASHLLDEVEKVCTHVAVLRTGKLLYSGVVQGMNRSDEIVEIAGPDLAKMKGMLSEMNGLASVNMDEGRLLLVFEGSPDLGAVNRFFFERGTVLEHLYLRKSSLEEQFLDLIREAQ